MFIFSQFMIEVGCYPPSQNLNALVSTCSSFVSKRSEQKRKYSTSIELYDNMILSIFQIVFKIIICMALLCVTTYPQDQQLLSFVIIVK